MGWAVKSVFALLILGVTLLGIHSEHLGLGPGDRQVYAIPVWAKLSVMMLFMMAVFWGAGGAKKALLLCGVGAIWLIQQQAISTSVTTVPPQVAVWFGGVIRIDTAHICTGVTGDTGLAPPEMPITMALKGHSFADANCAPRRAPLFMELPFLATFAPAGDDPMRARISRAIDAILGVS
jgi:hypothetical protein